MAFAFFLNYSINYTRRHSVILRQQCAFVGQQTQLLRNYCICHINLNVEFVYCAEYKVFLVRIDRHYLRSTTSLLTTRNMQYSN